MLNPICRHSHDGPSSHALIHIALGFVAVFPRSFETPLVLLPLFSMTKAHERQKIPRKWLWKAVLLLFALTTLCSSFTTAAASTRRAHGSNHALIVSSSRYWFNYRHVVNALSIYQLCKSHGIPDENIVLMLADELPTNARNPYKNVMTADGGRTNLYSDENIEIDYRGDEVTVDNLVKVLLGRHGDTNSSSTTTTVSLRASLHSDENSHVLVYWTGHGGDSFFKFQDVEEITSPQIARAFQQMYDMKRYKEILFIADTCQAFTLGNALTNSSAPNVYMVGSSLRDENSYAHHSDATLGLSVIERYTHALVQFLEKGDLKRLSLKQGLVDHLRFEEQRAHVGYRDDACERKFATVPMSDFFANVQSTPMRPLYRDGLEQSSTSWEAWPDSMRRTVAKSDTRVPDEATCREQEDLSRYQGVEPSDPLFLVVLVLFIGSVVIASQFV